MNTYTEYTPEERAKFVELAETEGIVPAQRQLGYPKHWSTGKKWCDKAGVDVSIDELQRRAKSYDLFYKDREKMVAAQAMLLKLFRMVDERDNLDADELNKLANAMQRVIQTIALIEGTPTDRRETIKKDGVDVELQELLNEARAANAAREQELQSD